MLVIARCPFNDLVAGEARTTGDKFTCDEERARHLAALNLVVIAKEQPEGEEPETPEEPEDGEPETPEEPEEPKKAAPKKAKKTK